MGPSRDAAGANVVADAGLAFAKILAELRRSLDLADSAAGKELASRWLALGDQLILRLRAGAGQAVLLPVAIEPLPFLRSLANLLQRTLDRRIEVTVDVNDSCPPCSADCPGLTDALEHLVRNARDAMPDGGHLSLVAGPARLADGSPAVRFAVSDSGVGMTDDRAALATRPFYSSNEWDPLRGLGLSAVEGFARQSGGAFELRTALGRGTTASLLLPRLG